jgi:hypothetical protein
MSKVYQGVRQIADTRGSGRFAQIFLDQDVVEANVGRDVLAPV